LIPDSKTKKMDAAALQQLHDEVDIADAERALAVARSEYEDARRRHQILTAAVADVTAAIEVAKQRLAEQRCVAAACAQADALGSTLPTAAMTAILSSQLNR
jgi:hypothetical protein